MKRILFLFLPLLGLLSSCSTETIEDGTRGLAIKRPYIFGSAGIEILEPRRHLIAWSTSVEVMDIRPFTHSESFDDMKTKDEEIVDFAVHFRFQLEEEGLDGLFARFGRNWYANNIRESIRTEVRDLCKSYSQSELTSNPAVSREISDKLLIAVKRMLVDYRIPSVKCTNVELGKVNPPAAVIEQIAQTGVQKQREKTEIAKAKAEEQRKNAEAKRAEADKEYMNKMNFTSEQYLKDKSIQIDKDIVEVAKSNPNMKIILNIGGNKPTTTVSADR